MNLPVRGAVLRLLIINSFLMDKGLFRLPVSPCVRFGR